jgi:hypothetical protein
MKELLSILEAISLITTGINHDPPEDGRKYGPKHVGASFLTLS